MKTNSAKFNSMNSGIPATVSRIILLIFVLAYAHNAYSQEQDTTKKARKNSIKVNITNPMIFGDNNYILGYERTIGKHQSFSVNVGTFTLGRLININTDSIEELNKDVKSVGLSLSGDYRFYIGPYFAMNSFNRSFEFSAATETFTGQLNADFGFRVTTLGFQLGYQFVFWNRVSLDMILFGPGVSFYKLRAELSTNLDPDQEAELFNKINEKLQEKIPGYSLVLEPAEFEKSGSVNTTSAGYRYIVMLGFRF